VFLALMLVLIGTGGSLTVAAIGRRPRRGGNRRPARPARPAEQRPKHRRKSRPEKPAEAREAAESAGDGS
jgi:hypothetical protein